MGTHAATSYVPEPESFIGTWRRFGITGPVYEVVGIGQDPIEGDRSMRVRLVETGEEIDYRFTDLLEDPREF